MSEMKILFQGRKIESTGNYTYGNIAKSFFSFKPAGGNKERKPLIIDDREIRIGEEIKEVKLYVEESLYYHLPMATYKGMDEDGSYCFEVYPHLLSLVKKEEI